MHLDLALMATFPDERMKQQGWGILLVPRVLHWAVLGATGGRKTRGCEKEKEVLSPGCFWGMLKTVFKRRKTHTASQIVSGVWGQSIA